MSEDVRSTLHLLNVARDGDEDAVNEICRRYFPRLHAWARGRLPAPARGMVETTDIVQEVLIRAANRFKDIEVEKSEGFCCYLRRAVINRIRDEVRKADRRGPVVEIDDRMAGGGGDPDQDVSAKHTMERFDHALTKLKPDEREAVVARMELELGYDEIADLLGRPSAEAARKFTSRSLLKLAQIMSKSGPASEG